MRPTTSGTCVGTPIPIVSPTETSAQPISTRRAETRATASGETAPSYGQPNAHDTYPRTRIPAAVARARTGAKRAKDSSIEAFTFRRLNVSDAAVKTAISRTPAASARSRPFSFGTRTG